MQRLWLAIAVILLAGCMAHQAPAPMQRHGFLNLPAGATARMAQPQEVGGQTYYTLSPSGTASPAFCACSKEPRLDASGSNYTWGQGTNHEGGIYLRSDTLDVHANLNQEAHSYDLQIDAWALLFRPAVNVSPQDSIWFCGPTDTVGVQVYDAWHDLLLYDSTISGLGACA